jgi:hypothetical protein
MCKENDRLYSKSLHLNFKNITLCYRISMTYKFFSKPYLFISLKIISITYGQTISLKVGLIIQHPHLTDTVYTVVDEGDTIILWVV